MSKLSKVFLALGLLAALGTAGYGYYQYQIRQQILWQQLQELDFTLSNLNAQASQEAAHHMKGVQANVVRNQSQPQEVAVLKTSTQLQEHTQALLDTLQAMREQLTHGAGYLSAPTATSPVARLAQSGAGRRFRQQLVVYVSYIQPFYAADSLDSPKAAPNGPGTLLTERPPSARQWLARYVPDEAPVALALASLTQLEAEILAGQAQVLAKLARRVQGPLLSNNRLLAVATAESNVVAYGATYQAQLSLLNTLRIPGMTMRCNGQPIAVGPSGAGQVRFVVPPLPRRRPDTVTAYWTGSISFRSYGRDTTFHVRVPYRIVRR